MALTRENTRDFHVRLYAGWDSTITLLKRGNDQAQGTVTSYQIFNARRRPSRYHTGEPIQNVTGAGDYAEFMLPAISLEAVGLTSHSLNAGDQIRDADGNLWVIESTDAIRIRLDGNYCSITCKWVSSVP